MASSGLKEICVNEELGQAQGRHLFCSSGLSGDNLDSLARALDAKRAAAGAAAATRAALAADPFREVVAAASAGYSSSAEPGAPKVAVDLGLWQESTRALMLAWSKCDAAEALSRTTVGSTTHVDVMVRAAALVERASERERGEVVTVLRHSVSQLQPLLVGASLPTLECVAVLQAQLQQLSGLADRLASVVDAPVAGAAATPDRKGSPTDFFTPGSARVGDSAGSAGHDAAALRRAALASQPDPNHALARLMYDYCVRAQEWQRASSDVSEVLKHATAFAARFRGAAPVKAELDRKFVEVALGAMEGLVLAAAVQVEEAPEADEGRIDRFVAAVRRLLVWWHAVVTRLPGVALPEGVKPALTTAAAHAFGSDLRGDCLMCMTVVYQLKIRTTDAQLVTFTGRKHAGQAPGARKQVATAGAGAGSSPGHGAPRRRASSSSADLPGSGGPSDRALALTRTTRMALMPTATAVARGVARTPSRPRSPAARTRACWRHRCARSQRRRRGRCASSVRRT